MIKTLAELAAQLPPNLSADWRDTNHFELHDNSEGGDYFWLDFSDVLEYLRRQESTEMPCETDHGKRIGLVMDCIEALSKAQDAINSTADQSRVIEVMQGALEHYADDEMWDCSFCANNVEPSHKRCYHDVWSGTDMHPDGPDLAVEALAEAKRIMEGE